MRIIRDIARRGNDLLTDLVGIRIFRVQRYDREHKLQALKAVQTIEKFNNEKLSSTEKKLADDYAVQVLGDKKYAPWLYVYTLIRGQFREGWIPDNFFGRLVAPKINKELRSAARFKTFTNVVLKTNALPDVAYYLDGIFYDRDLAVIDINRLREIIEEEE